MTRWYYKVPPEANPDILSYYYLSFNLSAYLLNDEKKIHLVGPENLDSNVWDYRYDLAVQVIEELL